jgi:DMSO/TMAO reductase YedYZ molybdopterin-dependent catalytic subunit
LKKKLFQVSLLALAFGLLLLSSLTGVFADSQWTVTVDGAVNNALSLTLDELAAMPSTTEYAELDCYGAPVTHGYWTGVRLGLLLQQAGIDQQVVSIDFYAQDGYQINLPIKTAMQDSVIVAYQENGQPLSEMLRLVIPGANGDQWIAWITSITASTSETPFQFPPDLIPPGLTPFTPSQSPMPTPKQPPTPPPPKPTTTPQENQTSTQPVAPPTTSQPLQQQGSSGPSLPAEYGYPIVFTVVAATVAVTGYLIYKRRR